MLFDLAAIIVFVWLFVKATILALKITWGIAKIFASLLLVAAVPILLFCLVFVGGFALLLPLILLTGAIGLLKQSI